MYPKLNVMATKVKFLVHTGNGELYAFFPQLRYGFNGYRNDLKTAYAHVGQHSACAIEYVNESRYATESEYKELKKELEGQGYELIVCDGVKTIDKIIYKVDTKRDAPMGRMNHGYPQSGKKVYDCKVPMSDGAYDKGGAYWGLGRELRVRYHKDKSYIEFYRLGDNFEK